MNKVDEMTELEKVVNTFEHVSTCAAGNAAAYRKIIREQLVVLRKLVKEEREKIKPPNMVFCNVNRGEHER